MNLPQVTCINTVMRMPKINITSKIFAGCRFVREYKQLFLLVIPILITQLAEIGIGVTAVIMSGRVSAHVKPDL